jgi:hypothetical protein
MRLRVVNGAHRVLVSSLLLMSATAAGRDVMGQVPRARRTPDEEMAACNAEKIRLQVEMAAVFRDFQMATVPRSVETLVSVDGRIRALLGARPSYRPCGDDLQFYDARWRQVGVDTGYWNYLSYSGQLLVEAHSKDPHSALRPYTLFSTVFGVTPAHGLGVMPDVTAALAYATEFPNGPFSRETTRTIADFHKDLFMVLRDRRSDYKFKCYEKYIGSDPWQRQKDRAKRVALQYYRRLLDVFPGDEAARRFSDELAREVVNGWSFCAD